MNGAWLREFVRQIDELERYRGCYEAEVEKNEALRKEIETLKRNPKHIGATNARLRAVIERLLKEKRLAISASLSKAPASRGDVVGPNPTPSLSFRCSAFASDGRQCRWDRSHTGRHMTYEPEAIAWNTTTHIEQGPCHCGAWHDGP